MNKKFQNKLFIDIDDYEKISDKIRMIEKNGLVKEYNYNGVLIFEGEYLNGKRNGKGKEFYDNG